jgi:hypothetical protein
MPDWTEQQARRLQEHISRTSARLEALAARYGQLNVLLSPGTGQPADWGMPVIRDPGPRAPLRVDVLDLIEDIDRFLTGYLPLVRGTMRLGPGSGTWTRTTEGHAQASRAGLTFLAAALASIYAEDPALGDELSGHIWRLDRRAGWIFGDNSRPFALAEACPDCSVRSLWVVPDRMVIRCANPPCGAEWPVDAAAHAHTTESPPGNPGTG